MYFTIIFHLGFPWIYGGHPLSQAAEWVSHATEVQKNPYCNVTVSGAQSSTGRNQAAISC
jgi:hypothetical protein